MAAYGDLVRSFPTAVWLARIRELAEGQDDSQALLLEAGELAQGLIDEEFHRCGADAMTPLHRAALNLVRSAATGRGVGEALAALERCDLPEHVDAKVPEGFALYAVYPELYAAAGRRVPSRRAKVIGIRTIGTVLGAVVAAAADAHEFVTVRPVGHPFRRELALAFDLVDEATTDYLVVDEGPGLSGSSFGCVADYLLARGVPAERIVFFPSHGHGPGAQADPRHRDLWERSRRAYVPFEALLGELGRNLAALTGPFELDPIDIGAGNWRKLLAADAPVWPAHERRKYVVRARGREWLIKFAGLAHHGGDKLAKAERLAVQGLTPPVAGFARGFLVHEWVPGYIADAHSDRAALLDMVARYLAALAGEHPPAGRCGLTPALLMERAQTCDSAVGRWQPRLAELDALSRPISGDHRMHAWEWIATPRGLRKTDAVDHAFAHDGIGPQDLAWDVAGACVELGVTAEEQRWLRERLAPVRTWSDDELAFYSHCYRAIQAAIFRQAASESWSELEAARLCRHAARYGSLAPSGPRRHRSP